MKQPSLPPHLLRQPSINPPPFFHMSSSGTLGPLWDELVFRCYFFLLSFFREERVIKISTPVLSLRRRSAGSQRTNSSPANR